MLGYGLHALLLLALVLSPGVAEAGHAPLRIKAMQYGFGEKSWSATLGANRQLTVQLAGEKRVFTISRSQVRRVQDVVDQERFFELADSYGQQEHDVNFRSICLTAGGRSKTVVVYATLGRETRSDEVRRALRVAIAIRSLFDWPAALDTREEDEKLLRSLSQ